MAATAVQATPELLEMILMGLTTRDLLLAQSVAKGWQDTIMHSKKIQRALFLQPVFKEPLVCQDYRNENRVWKSRWILDGSEGSGLPFSVYENPLLLPLLPAAGEWSAQEDFMSGMPAAWARPEASWRCMLLTQPTFEGYVELFVKRHNHTIISANSMLMTKNDRAGTFANKATKLWRRMPGHKRSMQVDGSHLWEDIGSGNEAETLRGRAMRLKKQGLWPGE